MSVADIEPIARNGTAGGHAVEHLDTIVVGAGISGIDAAYRLRERNPKMTDAILEGRATLGGTWDLFRYPGIRSDSDIVTLGFPFRPYAGEKSIVDGTTIREYVADTARHFGIDRKIRYGHRVVSAEWSSASARWTIVCDVDGHTRTFTCSFLLGCAGYYDYEGGHTPEWAGLDTFGGRVVHPQFWPVDLDVIGKRIVVIGSGATAVTLVPALAETAEHVTMLQRSPSYVASLPSSDAIAMKLRASLPRGIADALVRWKNIAYSSYTYRLARTQPKRFRAMLRGGVLQAFGAAYDETLHDVDVHFNPAYEPWDQRLCLVPDSDLFRSLRKGHASIVTGHIANFTHDGIRLEDGRIIPADVVVSATGLTMKMFGGIAMTVDGTPVDVSKRLVYKGTMLEGVPNFAFAFGYTHSSWTLKVDLNARYVARLMRYMKRRRLAIAMPLPRGDVAREPLLGLTSGYVQRAAARLPLVGPFPWRTRDNYVLDLLALLTGRMADGTLRFAKRPRGTRSAARTNGIADLRDKLVLVTGGGAGIGRAIALAFAKGGAHLVLSDVDRDALAKVSAEVERLGVRCATFVADVSDEDAMKRLADDVARDAGVPDVLVNNAGIGYLGPFLESPLDHWRRILGVNVVGVVNGCYYFLPKMIAAGGRRRVVVIASGAALYPPPNAAAYGASKAAAFSFAESLKMDLIGTDVGVTTVCPGITNTGIVHRPSGDPSPAVTEEQIARMREHYVKKGLTPEAVADAVVRGVERGQDVVLVGTATHLIYNLRRFSLPLTRRVNYDGAKAAGFR
ncbi:MAG: SDR family NAD(P)-dependent oxidoreductase [Candidatus Eremiobacteraeota bacterium]|nr:SDR family NAD(P)-dependent oxidoreductase [Candidatus Eremiobacteraeota bacterium]